MDNEDVELQIFNPKRAYDDQSQQSNQKSDDENQSSLKLEVLPNGDSETDGRRNRSSFAMKRKAAEGEFELM